MVLNLGIATHTGVIWSFQGSQFWQPKRKLVLPHTDASHLSNATSFLLVMHIAIPFLSLWRKTYNIFFGTEFCYTREKVGSSISQISVMDTGHVLEERRSPNEEHSQSAGLCQGESGLDSDSGSGWFPKFNGDFLVQCYICDKISMKILSVSPEIWAKLWKSALSCNVEESFKNSWTRMTSKIELNQFFLVHRHIRGKIFWRMHSVVFT